jgi:putative isomerase
MLKAPNGVFSHPIIDPGAGYEGDFWDWDSYWGSYALMQICEYCKNDPDFDYEKKRAVLQCHVKGNVLNFYDLQLADGFIPMMAQSAGHFSSFLAESHQRGEGVNQHKPFLAKQSLNAAAYCEDYIFLKENYHKLERYLHYYDVNQLDSKSGLYIWENDVMIGIDNNPAVFGRPPRSTADIYLNCFMLSEFQAMAEIADNIGDADTGKTYRLKADKLAEAIRKECWDIRDAFFYSVDVSVQTNRTAFFHHGLGAFWNTIPIKLRVWAGFLPMYGNFATNIEADAMVKRHYHDQAFLSPYGIRTLSSDERMYNTDCTSNPSNWLGPVWIVVNYCVFKGLLQYGYKEEAADLTARTIDLLAKDIEENGCMSESYVPETGKPMMYGGFLNWNALAVSMLKELEFDC